MSESGGEDDDVETHNQPRATAADTALSPDVIGALERHGVSVRDEVGLRKELEAHLPGYTLYRLLPAARRRWKSQYRIMYGDTYMDCQSVPEAYARALLAALEADAHRH